MKDVELLCIPRIGPTGNCLDQLLETTLASGYLRLRLNIKGRRSYGPKNKLLTHVPTGLGIDIFTADTRNWGMALLVRTGSADFNRKVMSRFLSRRMRGHAYGGVSLASGAEVDCPDEETVFQLLGWPWRAPEERG